MTPLLCVLVSMPGRGWRSRTQTEWPCEAMARAEARPVTPAPMTATSIRSKGQLRWPKAAQSRCVNEWDAPDVEPARVHGACITHVIPRARAAPTRVPVLDRALCNLIQSCG